MACKESKEKWVERNCQLITEKKEVNFNVRFHDGDTLLHALVKENRGKTAQMGDLLGGLLEKGADPNSLDWNGETPLMVACRTAQLSPIAVLAIHGGTLLDAQDSVGNSALAHAVLSGSKEAVETLIKSAHRRQHYRYLEVRNRKGATARDLAEQLQRMDLSALITSEKTSILGSDSGSFNRSLNIHDKDSSPPDTAQSSARKKETLADQVLTVKSVNKARRRFLSLAGVYRSESLQDKTERAKSKNYEINKNLK